MKRFYKNWPMHNIVAHPLMQILEWIGLVSMADKLHDATLPPNPQGKRRRPARGGVRLSDRLGHATDTAPRGHHTKRKAMSAIISPCGQYRYRLERTVAMEGPVYAFFGINPSTADASLDDATVRKWIGFTKKWGGSRFIVGNVFAFRATDVKALASVDDPYGPDIGDHITSIIEDADILVPCWGNTTKVPPQLQDAFDVLMDALVSSGKPVRHFGQTNAGDPKHPLMLAYDTPLLAWGDAEAEEA